MNPPKALIFDVFGTLVDWRTAIANAVEEMFSAQDIAVDARAFADAWRARYQPAMEAVRRGERPFCTLDMLHRENLDAVLDGLSLSALDAPSRDRLTLAWHALDAWHDVTPGLARLWPRFLLAPCSNGNIALMVALARRHGWHWDAVLGAELSRDYKPKPAVYLDAVSALGCEPGQVMMVAAHSSDLAAAAALGLRTAFVQRTDEHGPGRGESAPSQGVDIVASSLMDLADQLGAAPQPSLTT